MPDIDWFEGYFTARTREEKIEWLKNKHLKYVKSGASFTSRAHQFYGMVQHKLEELTRSDKP